MSILGQVALCAAQTLHLRLTSPPSGSDEEYVPTPARAARGRETSRAPRAPPKSATCSTCTRKFPLDKPLCPPCVAAARLPSGSQDFGYWESNEMWHSYLMSEIGAQVKPKAKADVKVDLKPISIDALDSIRRRFLRQVTPPGICLSVPLITPTRGATSHVLPKVWSWEITDWSTCGLLFGPAWRTRPNHKPGLTACGLVVILANGCAYVACPPFRFKLSSMCPLGRKLGKGSLKYDALILTDTGSWLPPAPGFPNLDALMVGASLDIIKIQQARMAQQAMGAACPLLSTGMVAAAIRVLPSDAVPPSLLRRRDGSGGAAST